MDWSWDYKEIAGPPSIPGVSELVHLDLGGMGQVYRGVDAAGRAVAVKVMRRLDPKSLARFQREAELLARFRSPEVVTAHSWGTTSHCSYLVCELIEGVGLDQACADLDPEGRAALVAKVARAIGVAHRQGVVHRDLKPSNVLVTPQGEVRLIDFGISIGLDQERLTQTGEFVGTPAYLPPEAMDGVVPTPASDVWSLGAVAYELLEGRLPYPTTVMADLARRVKPPPPLEAGVSSAVKAVLRRALDPNPESRYADGDALADALEEALAPVEPDGVGRAMIFGLVGLILFAGAILVVAVHARRTQPSHDPSSAPAPIDPTPPRDDPAGISVISSRVPRALPEPELASLPALMTETFKRGTLSDRWEAAGEVDAELVDRGGAVCLRVVSTGSGFVNTKPAVVRFPDMLSVRAIAIRMRSPSATPDHPVPVQVLLGGARDRVALSRTVHLSTEWRTHRIELKWMLPHWRAFPQRTELHRLYLRLPQAGEIEVSKIELLEGLAGLKLAHVLDLAFEGRRLSIVRAKQFAMISDVQGFDDERLYGFLRDSQLRLRQSLGPIVDTPAVLLLFQSRPGFDTFWARLGALHGIGPIRPDGSAGSYIHFATAVYAPTDEARLLTVETLSTALLARSLRMLPRADWLFGGVATLERVGTLGLDLGEYLARKECRRVPLATLITKSPLPDAQRWQAVLFVRWLEEDPQAPISLKKLLIKFREAGNTDLKPVLAELGTTLAAVEAAWWRWVQKTVPEFELQEPKTKTGETKTGETKTGETKTGERKTGE